MRIPPVATLFCTLALFACSREAAPPASSASTAPVASAPATPPPAAPAVAAKDAVFSREELDQMLAPIALYPDSLLAQVLMAATYPGDVADAVAWSKAHPDAKGDEAVRQVADQPWDPSVQSLVAFPQALDAMGHDAGWVQRVGDAFLAQPDDVMDAVQRLRHQARDAGNLASNPYQKISEQPAAAPAQPIATGAVDAAAPPAAGSTIVIEPSDPQVVYVPSYDPATTYGTWAYPSYPPVYYPPPPNYYPVGSALVTGMAFGVGMAITDSLWGGFDWDDDDIDINVNRYNNINVNRQINANQNTWQHNALHRDGVPYRDRNNREQFGRQLDGADRRDGLRGDDARRAQARQQARASMDRHGIERPAASNQQARDRARETAAQRPPRDPARERAQAASDRGAARDRGPATADRAQARERAASASARDQPRRHPEGTAQRGGGDAAAARDRARAAPHAASGNRQPVHRQAQSNGNARTAARQQAQARQAPRNNAFDGARQPAASRAAAQRGQNSHAAAQRPPSARQGGRPANRPSHPPQRQSARRH